MNCFYGDERFRGRKNKLKGRMRPGGQTLATSDLMYEENGIILQFLSTTL